MVYDIVGLIGYHFQKPQEMSYRRPILADEQRNEAVRKGNATYHRDVIEEIEDAIRSDPVVVVGMAQNPFVKKVRAALTDAKIPFKYLEYGSYFSQWDRRLAIKMWSGWPTFPQVYVKGVLIGGNDDTVLELQNGTLQEKLKETTK